MAKILLLGLEPGMADQLGRILCQQNHQVHTAPLPAEADAMEVLNRAGADLIFSAGDDHRYRKLLAASRRRTPELPFIVVTRLPETSEWLNALEAGATDYCSAPFEHQQVRWMLQAALPRATSAVA